MELASTKHLCWYRIDVDAKNRCQGTVIKGRGEGLEKYNAHCRLL